MFKYLFLIVLVYLFFQYSYINKINKTLDIYQIDNPNKNEFENILVSKSPTIFTNVSENFLSLQEYSLLEILKLILYLHFLIYYPSKCPVKVH